MANGSSRVLLLVFLVVGFAAGWLLHLAPTPPPPPPTQTPTATPIPIPTPIPPASKGTAVILVGPGADDLTIRTAEISKTDEDVLFWATKKKNLQLWIELDDDIFQNTVQGKYARYRVQCQGRRCFSDDIKPGATPTDPHGPKPNGYKCWQILLDSSGHEVDKADGMIIIRP